MPVDPGRTTSLIELLGQLHRTYLVRFTPFRSVRVETRPQRADANGPTSVFWSAPTQIRPRFEPVLRLRGRVWTPRGVRTTSPPGPPTSDPIFPPGHFPLPPSPSLPPSPAKTPWRTAAPRGVPDHDGRPRHLDPEEAGMVREEAKVLHEPRCLIHLLC